MPVTVRRRYDRQRPGQPAPWEVSVKVEGAARKRRKVDGRKSLKYAEAVGEALEQELRDGVAVAAARQRRGLTLMELFAAYWAEHGQFLAAAASEASYQNAWLNYLGESIPVARISAGTVAAAIAHWRAAGDVGPVTINHYVKLLQRVWGRAGLYDGCVVQPIDWPKLKLDEPEPVDRSRGQAETAPP